MTAVAGNARLRWWLALPLIVVPVCAICVVVAIIPPGWWTPIDAADPAVIARAADLEQEVTSAIHKVRAEPEPWGFLVSDGAANEWLATRLPAWIEHDARLEWPSGIEEVQVRFIANTLEVAASSGEGPVWRARFAATLEGDVCRLQPIGAGIGRLPVPGIGVRGLVNLVPDGTLGVDGAIELPAEFELVDGRVVRLLDFELVDGDLGMLFDTRTAREFDQDVQAGVSVDNAIKDNAPRTHDAR